MSRFHAVVFQDGNFDRSASVLSFDSKAARAAYRSHSAIRFEPIDAKRKNKLLAEGRLHRLVTSNESNTEFKISQ